MNVFETHASIIADYASYIRSFINIADDAIRDTVEEALIEGKLWPEPMLQFNPAYEMAGSIAEIAKSGVLHEAVTDILNGYSLYRHSSRRSSLAPPIETLWSLREQAPASRSPISGGSLGPLRMTQLDLY